MTSKEYIISKLESFIKSFPQARVRYELDSDIETHFVEILPNELYHLNEDYMNWEEQMFDDFIEMFPGESIGFITDDAIVGLDNIDFEIYGEQFDFLYTTTTESLSVCDEFLEITSSVSLNNSDFNEFFSEKNSNVSVIETHGCTNIKPNNKFSLAA